jgi:hypothetical protein
MGLSISGNGWKLSFLCLVFSLQAHATMPGFGLESGESGESIPGSESVEKHKGVCVFRLPVRIQFTQAAILGRAVNPNYRNSRSAAGLFPILSADRSYLIEGKYEDLTIRSSRDHSKTIQVPFEGQYRKLTILPSAIHGFREHSETVKVWLKDDIGKYYFIELVRDREESRLKQGNPTHRVHMKSFQRLVTSQSFEAIHSTPCEGNFPHPVNGKQKAFNKLMSKIASSVNSLNQRWERVFTTGLPPVKFPIRVPKMTMAQLDGETPPYVANSLVKRKSGPVGQDYHFAEVEPKIPNELDQARKLLSASAQ